MASILYCGSDLGIFTLQNGNGRSWSIESRALENWLVSAVAVDASTPNRVFAGTRGDGVWLSEDFGKSWKKPCYGKRGPGKVRSLIIDPHDSDTLYAGTEPIDLYVSHDAAASWTRLDSVRNEPSVAAVDYPLPTVEPHIREIVVDPKDPKTIYLALQVGFMLKTTDGGNNWTLLNKGLDADVHTIVINPVNTDKLFIATGGHDYRGGRAQGRALYTSDDGGINWLPTAMEFSQEYSVPLLIHPREPEVVYSAIAKGHPGLWQGRAGGAESMIIRTDNGGKSWHELEKGLSAVKQAFPMAMAIDEEEPDHLYAATGSLMSGPKGGELYSSDDGGDSWAKMDIHLPTSACAMRCVQA